MKTIILSTLILALNLYAISIEKILFTEKLDTLVLKNKTLHFDVGIGSGAFHFKGDPKDVFYTVTDRGVNIKCKDSKKLMGKRVCKKGKIFPNANFTPTIYKIKVGNNSYEVLQKIQIKDKNGIQVSGVSNPNTEKSYDINGHELKYDPNGLDIESIVRVSDGTFWLSEEYGGSILHVSSDGRILKRVVPKGYKKNLKNATYNISESLPKIISMRPLNRGIESIAISPDEKYLYFMMQSPLANPSKKDFKSSRNVRLFKYNIKKDKVIAEFVYQMDKPDTFKLDKNKKQSDVKISEMSCIGDDKLIVLERISKTTKFYKVSLKGAFNILNSKWDDKKTTPSLAQGYDGKFIAKTLELDTSNIKGMPKKIEGIAYIDEHNWILTNDNDFGISGLQEYIIKLKK